MKKILISALIFVVMLTACNPNGGGIDLPEGTPEVNGTISEFKAWMEENAGEPVSDIEVADQIVSVVQRCISAEQPDMMDNPESLGETFVFEGMDIDLSGVVCAYYGNATLSSTGTRVDINGRIKMGEFVLDITGYLSQTGNNLNIGGKNFKY